MLKRTLTIKEFHYEHDHLSTLTTRNNMAGVQNNQGKYDEALQASNRIPKISYSKRLNKYLNF
jgi:hypothetical protein